MARRRLLGLCTIVLAALVGSAFLLGGHGSKVIAHGKKHHRLMARAFRPTTHPVSSPRGKGKKHKVTKPRYSAAHRYAVQILPVLDRSVVEFDRAVADASGIADPSALDGACGNHGTQVNILASYFDGVPHPWPWYSALGSLHHDAMGAYHYMLGALQACQTAASSGDGTGIQSSVSDMSAAAAQMHSTDNYVRSLTPKL